MKNIALIVWISMILVGMVMSDGQSSSIKMGRIDYHFQTKNEEEAYNTQQIYKKVYPSAIKVSEEGELFMALPRSLSRKVPATLGQLKDGKIMAYPNWNMNRMNDTSIYQLHSVIDMEIDMINQHMWILDEGLRNEGGIVPGTAQILIWDMENDRIVVKYSFTQDDIRYDTSHLTTIVVNPETQQAFIADSGGAKNDSNAQIIRLSFNNGEMVVNQIEINAYLTGNEYVEATKGFEFDAKTGPQCDKMTPRGVIGLALSCDYTDIYFTPLFSRKMARLETIFFDYSKEEELADWIRPVYGKPSATAGLTYGSNHHVYITMVETHTVEAVHHESLAYDESSKWETTTVVKNETWPAAITIRNEKLYALNNRFCDVLAGTIDWDATDNFVIDVIPVDADHYGEGCRALRRRFAAPEIIVVSIGVVLLIIGLILLIVISCCWRHRKKFFATNTPLFKDEDVDVINYDSNIY